MRIYSDFDGTISSDDVTDVVLTRLANPEWVLVEELWKSGKIGSAACMQQQIAMIDASPEQLDHVLKTVEIDPEFPPFAAFCQMTNIPLTIISDGVDYFIHRILAAHGLDRIPVIANKLVYNDGRYSLTSPYSDQSCLSAAGVCKCRQVGGDNGFRIYIGDGRSDFCVSSRPELVFAKNTLAVHCEAHGIEFTPYRDFGDITNALMPLVNRKEHLSKLETV